MHNIHSLLVDLTLITIYAAITTLICKKLKQPITLGYVLAGIFAGPYFNMLPTAHDKEDISLWADIGVIFLLFGLGLEFSFKKMVNVGKTAMITANLNIIFMLFLGYATGLLLNWSSTDSFFLGSMISMSSTTIIIKAFSDLGIKKQKFTDNVFGVLIVEDLVGILLLVLLPTIAIGHTINGWQLALSALKLAFFLVLCFIIGIYIVPTFLNKIASFLTDEMLLLITLGLCFGMVLLATVSGFSTALGAFIMGSILAETPILHRIEKNLQPLKDFFGAVFFVSVGMMVNPSMFITYATPIITITLVVIIGKIFFSILGFIASGLDLNSAVHGAFSLAQVGEFAFIIASLGLSLNIVSAKIYPIIVAVSVITTFLTPLIIKSSNTACTLIEKILPTKWLHAINKYETDDSSSTREEKLWSELFKNYLLRLIIFSIILYSIILFTSYLQPYVHAIITYRPIANIILTSFAFLCMAPFLNALLGLNLLTTHFLKNKLSNFLNKELPETVSNEQCEGEQSINNPLSVHCQKIKEKTTHLHNFFYGKDNIAKIYYKLWINKRTNHLPLMLLTSIRILVSSFFIVTAVHRFLTNNTNVTAALLVLTIYFISRSNWLLSQYIKIEAQFLRNLKGTNDQEEPQKD